MAGPYGAAPFKFPPDMTRQDARTGGSGQQTGGEGQGGEANEMDLNDTEWPLEKTLPLPRGYTTIGMKREKEETGSPKGDPEDLKRSVTMIYTSKSVVIKPPDPRSDNGQAKIEEKKDERPQDLDPPPPSAPASKPSEERYGALMRARHAQPTKKSEFDPILQCPQCKRRMVEPKRNTDPNRLPSIVVLKPAHSRHS